MASVTSLGLHKPSAIPFLVAEGILPPEPSEDHYTWQVLPDEHTGEEKGHGEAEEEILSTDYCVVWSRGAVIQRVFRFEAERETVTQAVFAKFCDKSTKPIIGLAPSYSKVQPHSPDQIIEAKPQLGQSWPSLVKQHPDLFSHDSRGKERRPDGWSRTTNMSTNSAYVQGRALVVILKTQAHVYCLSGASHIVHLPFEVDVAFPCPRGILFQRKVYEGNSSFGTPKITVPPNSFASTNLSLSSPIQCMKTPGPAKDFPKVSGLKKVPIASSSDPCHSSNGCAEKSLPRLFTMHDPLDELGIVVEESASPGTNILDHQEGAKYHSNFIDLGEDLLYVSPDDELQQRRLGATPCTLAVTQNVMTGLLNIWAANDTYYRPDQPAQDRHGLPSGGKSSRRRSSYGQGIGTGATTPVFRGHTGGRDNSGITKLRGQASIDDIFSESFPKVVDELALKSDPSTSSRRISSLLARADLSTSHDKSAFTELASGHTGLGTSRRGPSLDMHGSRPKSDSDGRITDFVPARASDDTSSACNPSNFLEAPTQKDLEKWDVVDEYTRVEKVDLSESVRGLRKEMVLTKLQSIPIDDRTLPPKANRSKDFKRYKIFTLKPPGQFLVDDTREVLFLCIVDRAICETLIIEITIKTPLTKKVPLASNETKGYENERSAKMLSLAVSNIRTYTKISDACRIKDGNYFELLTIRESHDGMPEFSLQAPWGISFKIKIPPILAVHHPYQLGVHSSRREQFKGGLGRILSARPRAFTTLDHEGNNGRVDIRDTDGNRHRIEIQLIPYNSLVLKMIQVCDFVLSETQRNGESILRSWWDVGSWLRTSSEETIDIEWTAIVVVLFCLAVGLTDDGRLGNTDDTPRQRKRKGGLLRSSSGAITDLENWETMLREGNSCSTIFPGMQDAAWKWTLNPNNTPMKPQVLSKIPDPSKFRTYAVNTFPTQMKSSFLAHCLFLARNFLRFSLATVAEKQDGHLPDTLAGNSPSRKTALATVLIALHLLREEYKLNILAGNELEKLAPLLAQIGGWLGWDSWGFRDNSYYSLESVRMRTYNFDNSIQFQSNGPIEPFRPPSVLQLIESTHLGGKTRQFINLADLRNPYDLPLLGNSLTRVLTTRLLDFTPRTLAITNFLSVYTHCPSEARVEFAAAWMISVSMLETLPESVAVIFRAAMSSCQLQPPSSWNMCTLKAIGRDDIGQLEQKNFLARPFTRQDITYTNETVRDVHNVCTSTFEMDIVGDHDGSAEADRQAISRMLFKDDQRFAEATRLVHPLHTPIARCVPEPQWSDTELLEAQQELVKVVATRTLSVSLGRSLIFFSSRVPLLTEKLPIHGFTLSCVMKPTNTTVTADRNAYSEEKVSWAFFHAGVEAGLRISKHATGVDTSWILFNKPQEFKNRHAGFLLALGLNGHLKSIAKWVAFKYLTPKHTMTSIGLLLGLSASYLGTMDTLITRLLSVHVTRMLPPGAAELNISPLTQTSGIMGIGILYCNTQHRRMSEIMLSEMENVEIGDISSPLDSLRDEGYRLAAGFALGYINLGRGQDLKGLQDMRIVERLLALAVGTRKVIIVHVLDKATAAAVVAIALIFMKTQDSTLAHKINIPNTTHQFDYVRPDIFLLRTVARHLIMWEDIRSTSTWMKDQLPSSYQPKWNLTSIRFLSSADMPFLNIIAGLCLSIGLRFAGSGGAGIRNLLCHYLDQFIRIYRLPTLNYDGKLARITVRCCLDTVALATACVMAGTGDLVVFRRLRSLHGRTDADTPYGSHLAAHLAIGVLFLGGGTHTFSTSNVAIASLLCAFYPLFPNTVLDNKSHLQAFRHFWVLATEPRCLVARDADTHRPIPLAVRLVMRSGAESLMTAPCLLPELETIAAIHTYDSEYWPVTLDLINKPNHYDAFKRHQSIYVRRRAALDAHASVFGSTMQALNDSQVAMQLNRQAFCWIFSLPVFARFDQAERALVLPSNSATILDNTVRSTIVDDRLALETSCMTRGRSERLWNLRNLFAWADGLNYRGEKLAWIGNEVVGGLRAALEMKIQAERTKELPVMK